MTIAEFVEQHNIQTASERVNSNPNNPYRHDANHYKVTLTRKDGRKQKRLTLYFSQGYRIRKEPDAASVLRALALDASSVETRNFEEWAREYGYDPDSRKADNLYRACQKEARKLRKFLGEDLYEKLIGRFHPIKPTLTPGPVTVTREAKQEFRPSGMGGRFVPSSELSRIAFALMGGESQGEIARQMGIPQPRIHEAINGKNVTVALQMIRHLSGTEVDGPLWFVPESVDETVMHRSLDTYPDDEGPK